MDNFAVQLKVMRDILVKKRRALTHILTISENQETVLISQMDTNEKGAYFAAMNEEKQRLIDAVISHDDMFQDIFIGIKDIFNEKAKEYANDITTLQDEIKWLIEMDTKIRLQEEKNKHRLSRISQSAKKIDPSKAAKGHVLEQYKKNAKAASKGGIT